MKRIWTIIGVRNVPRSFKWYQSLFGQRATSPGHSDFGQLRDSDGTVLLCLHKWGVEDHPSLLSPNKGTPGNGLLLFFRVDNYHLALRRARALVPQLAEEPHLNPNTGTMEFSLHDLDGYSVTISALAANARRSVAKTKPKRTLKQRRTPTSARTSSRRGIRRSN